MTRLQQQKLTGEWWDRLCTLACERMPPTDQTATTNLRRAALGLIRFAHYCRNNLIDPIKALEQATIIQKEQKIRTAEDYMKEAKDNADAAQAS